jgi:hypothetical protein
MRRVARRFTVLRFVALLIPAMPVPSPLAAQQQQQRQDDDYARQIREHTSDPRFLPASVATLPTHPTIPSPAEHFGTIIGAPGVMHRTAEILGYYEALARATPRLRIEPMGTSEEGRPFVLIVIADDATMSRLDHYRAQLARLADPRGLTADEVERVIDDAKPVYYLNAGLHSPEMGSPQVMMELAYRLVASDEPAIRNLRENMITLINPVAEPDGRDKQVDWYYRYTKARTEWDDGFPRSAPYWGRYVYHDNNRDGLQVSQGVTRAIVDGYFRWYPTVMLDLHESVPLLYVMTGTGPYNETIDPITIGEWQVMANHDLTQLTAEGLPGVFTWAFYDGWWPGYGIWVANNHNSVGRFYETFGNAGANTYIRDLSNSRYAGDPATERTWYRPDPPTARVRWSARDNVNYMQAGVLASLTYAADNGRQLLRNFHRKGANSIERGRRLAPHGFVIPRAQRDPTRAAYLVNQLQRQGIEVHRRTTGDSAGDYVIRLDQPYRNHAVTLLTKQNFPANAAHPPYDDIAWTLGYLYGVDVQPVNDTSVFAWRGLELLRDTVAYTGTVSGSGAVHLIANRAQAATASALYWLREHAPAARAYAAETAFTVRRDSMPAGTIIVEGADAATARALAARFGLDIMSVAAAPRVARHELDLPRIAVYHTWFSTQDEGWVRYTLEQAAIPYTSIDKDDLRAGGLRARFDVILVPSVSGSVDQLIHGIDTKWGPLPYTQTPEFPAHGTPDSTDDMTGGPGFAGIAQLQRFVEDGGVLVTMKNSTTLAAETGIARALRPHAATGLFHPGSVVTVKARRADHPILYGFPETFHVFRGNGPLYQTARRDRGTMVLQYGTRPLADEQERDDGPMLGIPSDFGLRTDTAVADTGGGRGAADGRSADPPYVLSGMVRNDAQIIGHGAIFDVPVGSGRVVAFTFNPLHRFLNHHEFPLVWNTILNWNDLPR